MSFFLRERCINATLRIRMTPGRTAGTRQLGKNVDCGQGFHQVAPPQSIGGAGKVTKAVVLSRACDPVGPDAIARIGLLNATAGEKTHLRADADSFGRVSPD